MVNIKINGFHTATGGVNLGIMSQFCLPLANSAKPFSWKAVDDFPFDAQQLLINNPELPITIIHRLKASPNGDLDVPNYYIHPEDAAVEHWNKCLQVIPPELDKRFVILETINEIAKWFEFAEDEFYLPDAQALINTPYRGEYWVNNGILYVDNANWLGKFAQKHAELCLAEGYKWIAFGWSSGEPEPQHWQAEEMVEFLRMCSENKGSIGIALHEYSYNDNIWDGWNYEENYGNKIGRFVHILDVCDAHNLNHPDIHITEWGWHHVRIHQPWQNAMSDIISVGELYAQYECIKSAQIWALDSGWGGIGNQVNELFPHLETAIQTIEYDVDVVPEYKGDSECRGDPRVQYSRAFNVIPQSASLERATQIFEEAWGRNKETVGGSYDDAGIGNLANKTANLYDIPASEREVYQNWYDQYYPGTNVQFMGDGGDPPPISTKFVIGDNVRVTANTLNIRNAPFGDIIGTQSFGANGVVVDGPALAASIVWWKADFATRPNGWCAEQHLEKGLSPVPPIGTAQHGLHMSADPGDIRHGPGGVAEFEEAKTLRPGVIKVLSSHAPNSIAELYGDQVSIGNAPNVHWIIRSFLSWGQRNVTPNQFFDWTFSDTQRSVNVLRGFGVPWSRIHVEIHNEPNLALEGWGYSWHNGGQFAAWANAVLDLYKANLPYVGYMYPGLSPGGSIGGIRYDSNAFLSESEPFLNRCNSVGAHMYWTPNSPISSEIWWVDRHLRYNKNIWITEASYKQNNNASGAVIGDQYKLFVQALRQRPLVKGVTYFVASASDPDFLEECWIRGRQSHGIAQRITS